ncbi:hypothetical protein ACFQ1M_07285 [Sungkyunkwania multivorans]|uniref:Phenolic acid decarboxylase n=1 Tax=Sungkyunkwania multivorans TaxID=1173618 RepID=A0ABW3CY06_9FLAO
MKYLEKYKDRAIDFYGVVNVDDWSVKTYTLTKEQQFGADDVRNKVLVQLPSWTKIADDTSLEVYKVGILMIHEAREGVWMLFNWWTGGEMLDTRLFFADYETKCIQTSEHGNALKCIWEYEILTHERQSWIDHVLSSPEHPDFHAYINDGYLTKI